MDVLGIYRIVNIPFRSTIIIIIIITYDEINKFEVVSWRSNCQHLYLRFGVLLVPGLICRYLLDGPSERSLNCALFGPVTCLGHWDGAASAFLARAIVCLSATAATVEAASSDL